MAPGTASSDEGASSGISQTGSPPGSDGVDLSNILKGEPEENLSHGDPFYRRQGSGFDEDRDRDNGSNGGTRKELDRDTRPSFNSTDGDYDSSEGNNSVKAAPECDSPSEIAPDAGHGNKKASMIDEVAEDEDSSVVSTDEDSYGQDGSGIGVGRSPGGSHQLPRRARHDSFTDVFSPTVTTRLHLLKRGLDSEGATNSRPFKRVRSELNHDYINLLNADIADVVDQAIPHDELDLEDSQIGLTVWTSAEKEMFFEALSRLGADDVAGISRRVQTKGEMEIVQYLTLLRDAMKVQKSDGQLTSLDMLDRPAAVELSQACCNALEEAADEISLRQEKYEMNKEEKRWGPHWIITPSNWKVVKKAPPQNLESARLFAVGSWLRLSERIFMNSAVPEYNWNNVSTHSPAIRATALEDFRSLAISMTRRLVSTTIAFADARIRSKSIARPDIKNEISWRDVEAAAVSLGLKPTTHEFWTKSARRLRINVADEDSEDIPGDQDDVTLLPYDEVERRLGDGAERSKESEDSSEADLEFETSEGPIETESETENDHGGEPDGFPTPAEELGVHAEDVQRELRELFLHSALKSPPTNKPRRAAKARITSELNREAYAERLDARESYKEETRMWAMLGREPPEQLARVKKPAEVPPQYNEHILDDFYLTGIDWRDRLDRKGREWEYVYEASKRQSHLDDDAVVGEGQR